MRKFGRRIFYLPEFLANNVVFVLLEMNPLRALAIISILKHKKVYYLKPHTIIFLILQKMSSYFHWTWLSWSFWSPQPGSIKSQFSPCDYIKVNITKLKDFCYQIRTLCLFPIPRLSRFNQNSSRSPVISVLSRFSYWQPSCLMKLKLNFLDKSVSDTHLISASAVNWQLVWHCTFETPYTPGVDLWFLTEIKSKLCLLLSIE